MKEYKTYQARNAVKAALVTNHIKAAKKNGVSHIEAKAEAYRLYNIKAGLPFLVQGLKTEAVRESYRTIAKSAPKARLLPVDNMKITKGAIKAIPAAPPSKLPPLPVPQQQKPALPKPDLFKSLGLPPLPPLPKIGA